MPERGKYVVVEGNDGTGKSTQVELLAEYLKQEYDITSFIAHEPAGTPIADAIRDVIKDGSLERDPVTNLLLFTASRREIWQEAKRRIKIGEWVLSARNYLSTEAYQGHGEGVDIDTIRDLTRNLVGEDYVTPDYAFILTLTDETERKRRVNDRGELEVPDTFEMRGADFQTRVNNAYLRIAADHGIPLIDANQSIEAIQEELRARIGI